MHYWRIQLRVEGIYEMNFSLTRFKDIENTFWSHAALVEHGVSSKDVIGKYNFQNTSTCWCSELDSLRECFQRVASDTPVLEASIIKGLSLL